MTLERLRTRVRVSPGRLWHSQPLMNCWKVLRAQERLHRKVAEPRYQVAQQVEGLVAIAGQIHVFEERRDVADSSDSWLGDVLGVKREEHLLEVDRNTAGARELIDQAVRIDRSGRETAGRDHLGGVASNGVQDKGVSEQIRHPQTCRWLRSLLICW